MNLLPSLIVIFAISTCFLNGIFCLDTLPKRSCGRALSDRLALVCNNQFNVMKRSVDPEFHRRARRQVVDECCRQACIDATIQQYCMSYKQSTSQENIANEIPPQQISPIFKYTEIRAATIAPGAENIAPSAPMFRPVYKSHKNFD